MDGGPFAFGSDLESGPGVFVASTTKTPPPPGQPVSLFAVLGLGGPKPLEVVWPKAFRSEDGAVEIVTYIYLFGLSAMPAISVDAGGLVRRRRGYWLGLGLPLSMLVAGLIVAFLLFAGDLETATRVGQGVRFGILVVLGIPILLVAFRRWRRGMQLLTEGRSGQWRRLYRADGTPLLPPAKAGSTHTDLSIGSNDQADGVGRAIELPGTAELWRNYVWRRARVAFVGFLGLVIAIVVVSAAPDGDPRGVAQLIALVGTGIGGLAFVVGVGGLLRGARIRWLLSRRPWIRRRCRYRIAPLGANGQPALIIRADGERPEAVCSVSTTVRHYRKLPQGDVDLQVCGNPRRWAVVAPPDLGVLVVVKRPLVPGWSRLLRKWAEGP